MLIYGYLAYWIFSFVVSLQAGNAKLIPRIKDGVNAKGAELPYMVSLLNIKDARHFCGGTIISDQWVLTAAHCTESSEEYALTAEDIRVVTGTILSRPLSKHRVTWVCRHEKYAKNDSAINDIALLKVAPKFFLSPLVTPAKLPKAHLHIAAGTKALVAGWGTMTHPILTFPVLLQKLEVTITSENYCKQMYMPVLTNVYSVQLCTHETTGNIRGTCKGDSGGPLTINNTIVGIVSWSLKNVSCGTFPSVYTRVSEYVEWILKKMMYDRLKEELNKHH